MKTLSILLLCTIVIFIGCSPCFNTIQTARMLNPKTIEITPSYTYYSDVKDEYNWVQHCYGGRLGIGITKNISIYGQYGLVEFGSKSNKDNWSQVRIIGFGPKFNMTKPVDNKILGALYIPIGAYFEHLSDKINYFQAQPTMILTRQIVNNLDITSSTVLVISKIRDDDEYGKFIAQDIGLDFHIKKFGISIRPEVGIGIGEGSNNPVYQYSIGLSFAPSGYSK